MDALLSTSHGGHKYEWREQICRGRRMLGDREYRQHVNIGCRRTILTGSDLQPARFLLPDFDGKLRLRQPGRETNETEPAVADTLQEAEWSQAFPLEQDELFAVLKSMQSIREQIDL